METKKTYYSPFDDIVFEGRNKTYGAYLLRQEYHMQLKKASVLAISIILLFLLGSYMVIQIKPVIAENLLPTLEDPLTLVDIPKFQEKVTVANPAAIRPTVPASTLIPTQEFKEIKVVHTKLLLWEVFLPNIYSLVQIRG